MSTDNATLRELYPRESRMLRAIRDVLKKYTITENTKADQFGRSFQLTGGQKPYLVRVWEGWEVPPTCSCPDHSQRAAAQTGGYCKHIIAVLISHDELRCQLLDLFL